MTKNMNNKKNRFWPWLLLLFAGFWGLGVNLSAETRPHLILISIDTLRADHLGCYGYHRDTSPRIDQLAQASTRFTRCYTESPLTVPAMSTMMTSLPAYKHGAKRNGLSIYQGLGTLADSLHQNGYLTAGFISNWPLKDRLSGLGKGFVHYEEIFTKKRWLGLVNPEGGAQEINGAVRHWLEQNTGKQEPLFLWIHYSEPHAPYVLHKEFAFPPFIPERYGQGARKKPIEAYDTEIAYTDHQIGILLDLLKEKGLMQNAVVMLLADHGESFGEHHEFQHGRRLYNTCLQVPLILRLPKENPPVLEDHRLCSLADVAPTLMSCAGLKPESWMEGKNLLETGDGPEFLFSEAYKGAALIKRGELFKRKVHPIRFSIITRQYKLIYNQSDNSFEAYDQIRDPFEEKNHFMATHQTLRELRLQLIAHIRDLKTYLELGEKKYRQPAKMTQDDLDKLRSLGYID